MMEHRKILILGAGYAGMAAAVQLQKHHVPFTLINKHNYHYFKTLLHEAAGGRRSLQTYAIALDDILTKDTSHAVKDVVKSIDIAGKQVDTEHGTYTYDTLIIALGSQTAYFHVPGLKENSFVLNSLENAKQIRTHIEETFLSYKTTPNPEALRVVIGGAGLTGVELIGELADYLPHFLASHDIPADDFELMLVHSRSEILPGVDERLRHLAADKLQERGVRLVLNERIVSAGPQEIVLQSGATLRAQTLIWTGGVEANPVLTQAGFTVDNRGRAKVNEFLQSVDDPDVYIVGDNSLFTESSGESLPPTGQVAEQMGHHLSNNLLRQLRNEEPEPFVFHNRGMVASLGPKYGVAEVGHHTAKGLTALILKNGTKAKYLMHLGGPHVLFEKHQQWIEI